MQWVFILFSVLCVGASRSHGVVVINLVGNPNTPPAFYLSAGTNAPVPDGALIRIGTFSAAPAPDATFLSLSGLFHEFARTSMGNTPAASANTGHVIRNNIVGSNGPESPEPDSFFIGLPVYIWVFSDANGDTTGLEPQGIFSVNISFRDQASPLTTGLSSYVNAFGRIDTNLGEPASVERSPTSGLTTRFSLSSIPEPAAAALLGAAALAGFVRQRRRPFGGDNCQSGF